MEETQTNPHGTARPTAEELAAETTSFSLKPFEPSPWGAKHYRNKLAAWERGEDIGREEISIGATPPVLRVAGAEERALMVAPGLFDKVVHERHDVSLDTLRALPEALANPVAVFQSRTIAGAVVVLTEFKEGDKMVIAAVHLDVSAGRGMLVNRVASLYGKPPSVIAEFFRERPLYLNKQKRLVLERRAGLQLPGRGTPSQGSPIVPGEAEVVKFASGLQAAKAAPSAAPPAEPNKGDTTGAKPGGESSFNLTPNLQPDTINHDPNGPKAPRRAFREITGESDAGGDAGTGAQKRRKSGRSLASHAGFLAWAERNGHRLDSSQIFAEAKLEDAPGGGEHKILATPDGRFLKFTKPGLYGANGEDAGAYLQRWALHNEVFNDDVQIEGIVTLPGEHDARIVISQPFRKGRDATPAEIADYLTEKGFTEHEGRWVHPVRGVAVWDTITPGNVIMTEHGARAVDLQIGPAGPAELHAVRERTGIGRRTSFNLSEDNRNADPSSASNSGKPGNSTKPGGTDNSFDWWPLREPGRAMGIMATLSQAGVLEFGIEAGPASNVRGTEMFKRMMQHFGNNVKAIQGSWYYGDNLAAVKKFTAAGLSLEEAATRTWTGKRAAEHGYTKVKILEAKGAPGHYTEVKALFERP
jgi:hypothetical protein